MGSFTISYVPTVEETLLVQQVNNVKTVQDVETVHDVRKLPHPYFPLKKFNYQKGGQIHIAPSVGTYQAVYIPDTEVEFKGIQLLCTSYNIEDSYDVMIGSRFVIKDSHVKEMTEYRMFEVYEVVPAGTPIVINFHNNSGLEKYLMYEVITLVEEEYIDITGVLDWGFYWEGESVQLGSEDMLSLVIIQPNYVNMESEISEFDINVIDLTMHTVVAKLTYRGAGVVSNYVETNPNYIDKNFLARVNVTAIISVIPHERSIEIHFQNISPTDPHPIEIGISGSVTNVR